MRIYTLTFIAGDFNAYELRGEMKDKPKQLRSLRYRSFVPNSIITDIKHNSSIDNIYICSKRNIKESWKCTNDECGYQLRISDGDLLLKITLLMNRIIDNTELMIPHPKVRPEDSPIIANLQREIDQELNQDQPNEEFVISKVCDMANQLYKESQAKTIIVAQIARKRAMLMKPQEEFNCDYFADLVSYITLGEKGRVILHTKVETEIS